ncbi:hypothetical protein J8F10_06515 [Gemmata sp. G18]|uniref:Tyr recombinase domain-containing protein n=1 Tax=Gemmata palustris TaxID=2822762 RepID=A0ABS5BMI2_9BACT|nr:hypothetical protein [Gemmata palustris]MBP3954933.1 hypothetical protein [Gemmata palustris]
MAQPFENYTSVGDGEKAISVGYGNKKRNGFWAVVFVAPEGNRLEKMTRCKVTAAKKPDANFHVEAARIIVAAFTKSYPDPKRVTFAEALDKFQKTAPDLRDDTFVAYTKAVRIMRETLEGEKIKPTAPVEITPELASLFARLWLSGTYKRSKASDAKEFKRSPTTLLFYLRQLSAVWNQFIELGYAKENPWKAVRKPQVDKVRKAVPTEDTMTQFFAWVKGRYPDWHALHAFLDLKSLAGCRLKDICVLDSNQVKAGRVVWTAAQVKQREGRSVLLPDDLSQTLTRVAGAVYLWQGIIDGLGTFRRSKRHKAYASPKKTVYEVISNIFREYSNEHPEQPRLNTHALRRRAITLVVAATQNIDQTSQAIGITSACARGYYLDAQKAFQTDDIFRKVAGVLLPKNNQTEPEVSPTIPPLNGNNEAQFGT